MSQITLFHSVNFERLYIIVTIGVIIFFYHGWFEKGLLIGPDFQVRPEEFFSFFSVPSVWMSSLYGGSSIIGVSNASSPVYFLANILSNFLSYEYLQRVLWLFPFLIISFLSFRFLMRKFVQNTFAVYTGTLFFMVNPIILERFSNGQVWMTMAYALYPLIMGVFIDAVKEKDYLKRSVVLGLVTSIAVWYEPRITLLVAIPIIAYAIYHIIDHKNIDFYRYSMIKILKIFALSSIVLVLLNIYWLAPLIAFPTSLYDSEITTRNALQGVSQYAGNIFNTFQLYPLNWNESYTIFALVVPILSFSLLLTYHKRNVLILILSSTALVLIFLGKGSFDPFGGSYIWLLQNLPFAVAYRNPNKLWFVLALLYSFMLTFMIEFLLHRQRVAAKKKLGLIIICFIVISIVVSNSYFINGILGNFQLEGKNGWEKYNKQFTMFNPVQQTELSQMYKAWDYVKANSTLYSRTLWLPTIHGFRFGSEDHPLLYSSLFNNENFQYNHFFIFGPNGQLAHKTINYDLSAMLALGRIEHIILPQSNLANWEVSQTSYNDFKNILDSQNLQDVSKDIKLPMQSDRFSVLKSGTIIIDNSTILFQGINDKSGLAYAISEADLPQQTLSGLSFSMYEEKPETILVTLSDRYGNSFQQNIRTEANWKEYTINSNPHSDKINWQKLVSIGFTGVYGGNTIHLKDLTLNNGLRIYRVDNPVPVIYSPSNIILTNDEIKDALDYSNNRDIRYYAFINKNSVDGVLSDNLQQVHTPRDDIRWKKIDSTTYKVEVVQSVAPRVIVFTESFDPNWAVYINNKKINNSHFMVNGYANGFYIDNIGSYELTIKYEPQAWFYAGIIVSSISFTLLVAFLVWSPLKRIS